jgi:hypothetical protein
VKAVRAVGPAATDAVAAFERLRARLLGGPASGACVVAADEGAAPELGATLKVSLEVV